MTTFTIDDPIIEENYTVSEIKNKFLYFIQTELKKEKTVEFSELSNEDEQILKNMPEFNWLMKTFSWM